ncbi:DedA family protein [Candidatus Laterigemmans baculatus]|uniref:DedA family protein n=1 Tax=Candidatus Laterigemmans baculatus TaxID=2770505 RepID=UPI0013DD823A|nr:DedA family protein [Candidatus Laterigemmans baculatus]
MKDWINSVMETMGYPGIAFLMFLENVFPPIPSELIMPAAGFAAAEGQLTLWGVILSGAAGSVIGQLPLYYLGRALGLKRIKRLADRHGRWLMVSAKNIERADQWFNRHGWWAVFICRVIPGLRSYISIPAGIARMNLVGFLAWTMFGTAIWTTVLAFLGLWLGQHYEQVGQYLGPVSTVVGVAVVVAIVGWIVKRRQWVKRVHSSA